MRKRSGAIVFFRNNLIRDACHPRLPKKVEIQMADMMRGCSSEGEHLPCKQGVMSSNLTISTGIDPILPVCLTYGKEDKYLMYIENCIENKQSKTSGYIPRPNPERSGRKGI